GGGHFVVKRRVHVALVEPVRVGEGRDEAVLLEGRQVLGGHDLDGFDAQLFGHLAKLVQRPLFGVIKAHRPGGKCGFEFAVDDAHDMSFPWKQSVATNPEPSRTGRNRYLQNGWGSESPEARRTRPSLFASIS